MGAESRLRQRHRDAIRDTFGYLNPMIVGQPASAYTGQGRTDLYVLVAGRYVGLELKTSAGRATPVQLDRITRVRRAGGWADVVRSPDDSVRLIKHALNGGCVWSNLFDDEPNAKAAEPVRDSAPVYEQLEITAFAEPEPPDAEETEKLPHDSPFEVITRQLEALAATLAAVARNLEVLMRETGVASPAPSDQSLGPNPQAPALGDPPSPQRRSRRKG